MDFAEIPITRSKSKVDSTKAFAVNVVDSIGDCYYNFVPRGKTITDVKYCAEIDKMYLPSYKKQSSLLNRKTPLLLADNVAKITKLKLSDTMYELLLLHRYW